MKKRYHGEKNRKKIGVPSMEMQWVPDHWLESELLQDFRQL
jgi:hypothetical protein